MAELNAISIIALKVNGLYTPIKGKILEEWIFKNQGPTICCLQEICFTYKDTNTLKVKGF